MKLLFLDFDGVLNSYRTDIVLGDSGEDVHPINELDPIAVGLVKDIVAETGCVICLSSSYRLSHDYMELGKELKLPIMFETGHKELSCRGLEIERVVEGVNPTQWCILDDITKPQHHPLDSQLDNFVKVNTANGISYKNYLDCIEILK
jgi:hypothetical protein